MKIVRHRPIHLRPLQIQRCNQPTIPEVLKPRKKKGLCIGINYQSTERKVEDSSDKENTRPQDQPGASTAEQTEEEEVSVPTLQGPHRDALSMREFIIENYGYKREDTVVLIDKDGYMQPTKANIIREIKKLVEGAQPGDHFFFHYAGHSLQRATDSKDEEDGMDEFILAADKQEIKDDDLRDLLVKPLPIGSYLVAVFDSCHSASLLDLDHFRCNRVYVPWISKGKRRSATKWNQNIRKHALADDKGMHRVLQAYRINSRRQSSIDQVINSPFNSNLMASLWSQSSIDHITYSPIDGIGPAWFDSPGSPVERCQSPEQMFCSGFCELPLHGFKKEADVISLSAAKDGQQSWETLEGESMTQSLLRALSKDLHPSLGSLVTTISHDLHKLYLGLHGTSRSYKHKLKAYNAKAKERGLDPLCAEEVEMVNFQDPQISSHQPLDMVQTKWDP